MKDLSSQVRRVRAGDAEIAFLDVPARAEAPGEPLLLVHGITATLSYWKQNVAALSERHRVIAVDLPGYGRSDKPDAPYTMPYFVGALRELCTRLGAARPTIVGNSMGGLIAMRYALAHPDEVSRLVLVAPAGITDYPRRLMWLALKVVERAQPIGRDGLPRVPRAPAQLVRLLFRAVFPYDPEIAERYARRYVESVSGADYARHVRTFSRSAQSVLHHHVGEHARAIRAPTLILWGARDPLLPASTAKKLRRLIPDSRVLVYARSGHCPMVDQPERFDRDLLAFLGGKRVGH